MAKLNSHDHLKRLCERETERERKTAQTVVFDISDDGNDINSNRAAAAERQ